MAVHGRDDMRTGHFPVFLNAEFCVKRSSLLRPVARVPLLFYKTLC